MAHTDSFVVAAIVAAVLLADRLGGPDQLGLRLYQVATGFALALVVVAGTTAFLRPDALDLSGVNLLGGEDMPDFGSLGGDAGNRARESAAVHIAAAAIFVVAGLIALRQWKAVATPVILGGALLFVGGGGGSPAGADGALSSLFSVFGATLGGASEGRDIAYFIVLLVAAAALLGYGLWRWDMPQQQASV